MSSREARANFSELIGEVYYTKEPVIVERKGKPFAVVVSPEQFEQIEKIRQRGWEAAQTIQVLNADKDPEEVYQDVTHIVETVRQEMYDEQKKATSRGR